ncbi:MAG: TadE/TadG family type IV pilus assembly protein [Pseudomonadota bacterium]
MMKTLKRWRREDKAVIAVEVGLLMPVMLTLMMGIVDTGVGVLTSQKVINAVQTVGDLLGREETISTATLNDTVEAGKLALMPYDTTSFGMDVASIQYVGGPTHPTVIWRDTINMDPNQSILDNANDLGSDGDGVLGVTVRYIYEPFFSGFFTGPITISEVSYVRGRKGLFIPRV